MQSIEILKDGASTTYGADAVAGVVNLKFWKDYRGTQVTLQYGNTIDKDAAIYQGDVLFGIGDDKVSLSDVMISMQKASIGFQATVQVRNKLVSAYHEIMNMQV